MEKVEIKKLIEQCLNYFYESGYAKGTIDYYKCLWTKGILQYMSDKGIDMYTPRRRDCPNSRQQPQQSKEDRPPRMDIHGHYGSGSHTYCGGDDRTAAP